jgi:hypothetical protein
MGEAAEGVPLVIARHTRIPLTADRKYHWQDMAIDYRADIYVAIMGKDR